MEYMPILNGDMLYKYIDIIKSSDIIINNRINMSYKKPKSFWVELPFIKAFKAYSLTPNINPQNFIKHLEENTLSDTYKQFLRDVGFSLEHSSFSKELQNTIKEANDLFLDER